MHVAQDSMWRKILKTGFQGELNKAEAKQFLVPVVLLSGQQ